MKTFKLYIVSKFHDDTTARIIIKNLLTTFDVVGVDGHDCRKAIDTTIKDFEDALVVVCAEKEGLEYIITNDKQFLSQTDLNITAIRPSDFLMIYEVKSLSE